MRSYIAIISLLVFGVSLSVALAQRDRPSTTLTIYTSQKEYILEPMIEQFSEESGVRVRLVYDQAGPLLQRLQAEGARSRGDVLLAVDAGNLWLAQRRGLLAATQSEVLENLIPPHLREQEGHFFGLSQRARSIVYNPSLVSPEDLSSYQDLATEKWQGQLCLRTSDHVYNQSLVAMSIALHGEERTEEVVRGWVNNLAAAPFANDTQLLQAMAEGRCSVGIANHYYLARLKNESPEFPVEVFWANQDESGVHVNIFGGGVLKSSSQPEVAKQFLEWVAERGQSLIADANFEYPASPLAEINPLLQAWGAFKPMQINIGQAGELQSRAVRLMDRARYR